MKIISLGVGVQSTTIYYMSSIGFIKRADYAIFADPGLENPQTYEYLKNMIEWQKKNDSIPIIWDQSKNLYRDLLKQKTSTGQRFASIPAYAGVSGMLRRQCTQEYKLDIVIKKTRELHGLVFRQRMKPTEMWIGISTDEAGRMKDSRHYNIVNKYPLIDLLYSRQDCKKWLINNGFEVPPRSACDFCPYHSDYAWKRVKSNPERWAKVVEIDTIIRDLSERGVREQVYLHKKLIPIDQVSFSEDQMDLFGNECEGMCGL